MRGMPSRLGVVSHAHRWFSHQILGLPRLFGNGSVGVMVWMIPASGWSW